VSTPRPPESRAQEPTPAISRTPGLASDFSSPEQSPGFVLWRTTNRWQAAQRAALRPLGLTHVQFVLLASLSWLDADGPVTQRRLADHAAVDAMMTSQVVRGLEERGLVRRSTHPEDRRARALTVTAEGRDLANRAVKVVEDCDRRFFAPLQADLGRLTTLLRRVTEGPTDSAEPLTEA
jgi:DNA-binding MarR family transcriptional regulator